MELQQYHSRLLQLTLESLGVELNGESCGVLTCFLYISEGYAAFCFLFEFHT